MMLLMDGLCAIKSFYRKFFTNKIVELMVFLC